MNQAEIQASTFVPNDVLMQTPISTEGPITFPTPPPFYYTNGSYMTLVIGEEDSMAEALLPMLKP